MKNKGRLLMVGVIVTPILLAVVVWVVVRGFDIKYTVEGEVTQISQAMGSFIFRDSEQNEYLVEEKMPKDLKIGDKIKVYYDGVILEVSPAYFTEIRKVEIYVE
jgi:hypothetical protein